MLGFGNYSLRVGAEDKVLQNATVIFPEKTIRQPQIPFEDNKQKGNNRGSLRMRDKKATTAVISG